LHVVQASDALSAGQGAAGSPGAGGGARPSRRDSTPLSSAAALAVARKVGGGPPPSRQQRRMSMDCEVHACGFCSGLFSLLLPELDGHATVQVLHCIVSNEHSVEHSVTCAL
jgi:hypothetical protein